MLQQVVAVCVEQRGFDVVVQVFEQVAFGITVEDVIARGALKGVVSLTAGEGVITGTSGQGVRLRSTLKGVDVGAHSRWRLRIWRGDATGVATAAGENPAVQRWPWWLLLSLTSHILELS